MASQTQVSSLKIGTFRQIVPLIFLWEENGRTRSAENFIWNSQPNSIVSFENRQFLPNRPPQFSMRWEKPRAQLGKFHIKWIKMANQTQFSSLKIGNCRQIVPLIFLWDEKGRARAARKLFQYITYFLMDFLIERRAQRENVFNI